MMLLRVRFGRSLPRVKSQGMRREVYLALSATRFFAYEGEADVKSIEELVLGNKTYAYACVGLEPCTSIFVPTFSSCAV